MFLMHKLSGNLVEVVEPSDVYDPCLNQILGRFHAGEELQDIETFSKAEMLFPSGESLPICWLDPNYRTRTLKLT
jgi:hypothetical protein